MFFSSKLATYTWVWINQIMDWMAGGVTPSPMPNGNCRLMTAFSHAPNQNSVPADFTEATFSGYVASPAGATLTGPINLINEAGRAYIGNALFVAGGGLAPGGQTVVGYWLDDGAVTPKVIYSELFTTPINFAAPGDFLNIELLTPMLTQQPTGY